MLNWLERSQVIIDLKWSSRLTSLPKNDEELKVIKNIFLKEVLVWVLHYISSLYGNSIVNWNSY